LNGVFKMYKEKQLIRAFSLITIFILFYIINTPALSNPLLDDYTFKEDFENGSVASWSSYPPFQDTAYDPTIWVKPLAADKSGKGKRALYREITPNRDMDYEFGVRKKLNMYVDQSSILSFRCYIKSYRGTSGVLVKFSFGDGESAERLIRFTEILTWKNCVIRMADFLPAENPKKLSAVAFMAVCPNTDKETLIRFGIDDVIMTGQREATWKFSSPKVHCLDEWQYLIAGRQFTEGEKLTLSGSPPFVAESAEVILSRALTGEDEKKFSMKRASGNHWSVSIPLTAGIWRAKVYGLSREKKGVNCTTSMVFLVKRKNAPLQNPRTLLGPGDASQLRRKASSGRMKIIWEKLKENARIARETFNVEDFTYNLDSYDDVYWLHTYSGRDGTSKGYIDTIRKPANYIRSNAVVYAVSGDVESGDAACRALIKMSQWPTYVHPHILNQGEFTYWPVGQILIDFALGFDMVCDRMSLEERRAVAEALYNKGVTEIFKEYVRDNRISSQTSNWISDIISGGILCVLSIMDDYPSEELEPYLTGMILKLNELIVNTFGEDGSYCEGFDYLQRHTMKSMNPALAALDRTYGVTFPYKLREGFKFVLYQMDSSNKKLYDFGDTRTHYTGSSHFSYLIAKYRDPYLKWLYDIEPGTTDVDLFLMDDTVPAKGPEELPTVALFRDVGTAIFRSGFRHEDFVFVFRCGPFYNHQHFDQGSFFLSDLGEDFITEPGKSDYYKDPWYPKFVIQAGGHNCILVDENPESQNAGDFSRDVPAWNKHAIITDFVSYDGGAFVSGRLDPVYRGKLHVLRRSALYCEPRTVLLIDEVVSNEGTKAVNLRFHAPLRENIGIGENEAFITRPRGTLTIKTLAPRVFHTEILKRPLTLYEFNAENTAAMKDRGFLQLSTDLKKNSTTIVNVLTIDNDIISSLDEQDYDDHVVVTVGKLTYYINTTCGGTFTDGIITASALVYAPIPDGYIAMRATKVTRNDETLLISDKPVSLLYRNGTYNISAHENTYLTIKTDLRPNRILIDDKRVDEWKYDKKSGITIMLKAGSEKLEIR